MVIFLYGEDSYSLAEKLGQYKDKFIRDFDPSGLNIATLEPTTSTPHSIALEATSVGLLAPKRLIIIKRLLEKVSDEVTAAVEKIIDSSSDNIIVFVEYGKPKQSTILKRLKEVDYGKEFPAPTEALRKKMLADVSQKTGKIFDAQIVNALTAQPIDLWTLHNTLDILTNISSEPQVSYAQALPFLPQEQADTIFALVDAVAMKDKATALKQLHAQLEADSSEMYVLHMLTRHFRILLQIKDLVEKNPRMTSQQIAEELEVHPYVAKKSLAQVSRFTTQYLEAVYRYLLSLDRSFKNSFTDPVVLIDTMIAKL